MRNISIFRQVRSGLSGPVMVLVLLIGAPQIFAQLCTSRQMSPNLGATGIAYLEPGQWDASVSYRMLHTKRVFAGTQELTQFEGPENFGNSYSINFTANYAVTRRFSLTLDVPYVYGEHHWAYEHDYVTGHSMIAKGLGDVSLVGNFWLLDPAAHSEGNVSFSFGVKAPTGKYNARALSYQRTGPVMRPVDLAAQPGDGGWGAILQMQAFHRIFKNTDLYAAGFYLINPRKTNGTETVVPLYPDGAIHVNGVPDQYMVRVGLSHALWPEKGLYGSVGPRIDGQPVRDLIGGSDDGFRRPGHTISIEPGLRLAWGRNLLSLNAPIGLERKREQSVLEKRIGAKLGTQIQGGSAAGDFVLVASFSRGF